MSTNLIEFLISVAIWVVIVAALIVRFGPPLVAALDAKRARQLIRNERATLANQELALKLQERQTAALVDAQTVEAVVDRRRAEQELRAATARAQAQVAEGTIGDRLTAEQEIIEEELAARKLAIQRRLADGSILAPPDATKRLVKAYAVYLEYCEDQEVEALGWSEWRYGQSSPEVAPTRPELATGATPQLAAAPAPAAAAPLDDPAGEPAGTGVRLEK